MKKLYAAFVGVLCLFFYGSAAFSQAVQIHGVPDSVKRVRPDSRDANQSYNKILLGDKQPVAQLMDNALQFKQPYVTLIKKPSLSAPDFFITKTATVKPALTGLASLLQGKKAAGAPAGSPLANALPTGSNLNGILNPGLSSGSNQAKSMVPGVNNALLQGALSGNPSGPSPGSLLAKTLGTTAPANSPAGNTVVNTNALAAPSASVKSVQAAATSLVQVPNPLANNAAVAGLQGITGNPSQLLSGFSGLSGNAQMQKMAALRSQLLTGSIAQNLGGIKSPTFSSTITVENDLLYQPVLGVLEGNKYQDVIGIKGNFTAFGIPLNVNITNNQTAFNTNSPLNSSLFKFGFSPSMFSGLVKSDLQQYAGLKNTVFHGFNFTDYVHQTITEKISALQGDESQFKNTPFSSDINDPAKLQGLIKLSDEQLKQKLETEANEQYVKELKAPNADTSKATANRQLNYARGDSLAAVIGTIKSSLVKNGQDPNKLLLEENYTTGKTSSTFNSSELANGLYTRNPENVMQSLLGNVKDLKVGSFGTQVPGSTGDDSKLMSGANLSVRLGDYPLTIGYGGLNDINSLKDQQFNSSVYAFPKNITYLGTEINRGNTGDVKIAVVSSFNGQSNNVQYSAPTLPGNAVAVTATKGLKIDDFGNFAVDVSKSATLFSSNFQPGAEAVLSQKAAGNNNLSTSLFQSFAIGFTHNLAIPHLEASDNLYFNYAGLGYQNPANNGYSGATIKMGGDLKKKLYKNKLTLDFRTDYRSMPLSYTANDTWRNYQVQFDSRYQFTQKLNVSLKYINASTAQNLSGVSSSVYSSSKLEMSANDSYKIGTYFTTSQLNISTQSLSNTYQSATTSSLVSVNYAQSVIMNKNALTGTLYYNKELSSYKLIGDLLSTDVTYQYHVFKNMQLASGVTYLNNTGIAQQAGIRQSLQFMAGKHFDITGSVDLRKNLITPQYADLYSSTRGELSLKYYFKID